jgi:hypothetical protein
LKLKEGNLRVLRSLLSRVLVGAWFGEPEPASGSRDKQPGYAGKTLGEWVALTKDEDKLVRYDAAWALGKIGSEARIATPALTELLKDLDADVRYYAALALGNIGRDAKTAIPALVELLEDMDEDVRRAVAEALGYIGSEAKTAISALTEVLGDENESVRKAATETLEKIKNEKKPGSSPFLFRACSGGCEPRRGVGSPSEGRSPGTAVPPKSLLSFP